MMQIVDFILGLPNAVADVIRSCFPWHLRPTISNWLVYAGVFAVLAPTFVIAHFALRKSPSIVWEFEKTGSIIQISSSVDSDQRGVRRYQHYLQVLQFRGQNVSGHDLHSIRGFVMRAATGVRYELFIAFPSGGWRGADEFLLLPNGGIITLGCLLDGRNPQGQDGTRHSLDEFLTNFGAFTLELSVDGVARSWKFTVDELRQQIERSRLQAETAPAGPLSTPGPIRKGT